MISPHPLVGPEIAVPVLQGAPAQHLDVLARYEIPVGRPTPGGVLLAGIAVHRLLVTVVGSIFADVAATLKRSCTNFKPPQPRHGRDAAE